ncbi:EF-hand domain-containing protein [Rhizobium sp. Leaf383]|uniref:EF-hand domain-containing protein n=1 Tax=Rhizobium sp. Leaf383 TaxID=1736357 RepID=UPI0007126EE5|nr:EF-hand domain-containing protein [Rhizobium sp. Leaf383]KQS76423.1 hypothetical protein ASG58_11410 [Rhizobium sp. Leaf383]
MRIGSASDIYQLFVPRAKAKDSEQAPDQPAPPVALIGNSLGADETAAAFLAQLARHGFERDDTNADGFVDRAEYVSAKTQMRPNGYQPSLADVEKTWSQLDSENKGRLDEQAYSEGFSKLFQAKVGTFDKPLR